MHPMRLAMTAHAEDGRANTKQIAAFLPHRLFTAIALEGKIEYDGRLGYVGGQYEGGG